MIKSNWVSIPVFRVKKLIYILERARDAHLEVGSKGDDVENEIEVLRKMIDLKDGE